jgi:endonuclease YncB( thermonuclease family)
VGAIIEFPEWARRQSIAAFPARRRQRRRNRYDRSGPVLVGLVLAAAAFFVFSASIEASGADGISARVIDGDTIENTATGERIRLANIDTPETGERAQCAAEREAGERAERAARNLISTSTVTVDPTGRVDSYGRTIARVRVDGQDMGRILIDRGLARPWRGRREPWCGDHGELLSAV